MSLYNSNPTDAPSALHAEKIRRGLAECYKFYLDLYERIDKERKEGGDIEIRTPEGFTVTKVTKSDEEASREDKDSESKKEDS